MKLIDILKIFILFLVIGVIAYLVVTNIDCCKLPEAFRSEECVDCSEDIIATEGPSDNFKRIEERIKKMNSLNTSAFSKDDYDFINESIKGDKKISVNEAKLLSNDLFSVYADKFKNYAEAFFRKDSWSTNEINFIRSEVKRLYAEPYMENRTMFRSIENILSDYDKALEFIAEAKKYEYTPKNVEDIGIYGDFSESVDKRDEIISKSTLKNNEDLIEKIRLTLNAHYFDAHLNYLEFKVENFAVLYRNFKSFSEYKDSVLDIIQKEIENFKDAWKVDISYLSQKLDDIHAEAFDFHNR